MHPEAIILRQKRVFDKLKNFPEYYLAGGTALALQIGHRISIDFDFFSKKEIPFQLLPKIRKIFKNSKVEIIINHLEQLTISINGVNLTFVKYSFPLIFKLKEYKGIRLLSVLEIAATKAYVMGRRATLKDYVDLYYILKEKYLTLPKIIEVCQKKYKGEFNLRLFLEQLIYLEDLKEMDIEFIKTPVSKEQMAKFFQEEVKKIKF